MNTIDWTCCTDHSTLFDGLLVEFWMKAPILWPPDYFAPLFFNCRQDLLKL